MMINLKKISIPNILKMLGSESIGWLIFGVFATFFLSLLEISFGSTLQLLIGKLSQQNDVVLIKNFEFLKTASVRQLCILIPILGLLRGMVQIFTAQSGHFFDTIMNTRLRNLSIYDLLISARTKTVAASDINLRFAEIFPKAGSFIATIIFGLVAVVQVLMVGVACVSLNWRLSIFGLFSIFTSGLMLLFVRKKVLALSRTMVGEQAAILKLLQKITRNWIFIKISRTGENEYKNILLRLKSYSGNTRVLGFIIKFSGIFPTVLGTAVTSVMIFVGFTYLGLRGAEIVGFTYLFYRFIQQFSAAVDSATNGTAYYSHFKKAFDFFYSIDERHRAKAFNYFKNGTVQLNGKNYYDSNSSVPMIEIKNLKYRWETGPDIFSNFNLKIPSGSIFGIVGPSGSGKSTLLSMILGILTPQEGEVLVGGKSPEKYFDLYSDRVGYVGPEPFLNEGSVRENLIYGMPSHRSSDEKIKVALSLAQLDEFADKLDYHITENGEGFSSGQKQRISLARAFMKNPQLLILDEATSNLDFENERMIANILREYKKDCTIIIVSHRPGILIHADYTLDLNNNFMVEEKSLLSPLEV